MLQLLLKNIKLILAWGIILGAFCALVSFLIPKSYGANSQILVISNDKANVDSVTQSRSAQIIGENLAQVMQTEDFYTKALSQTNFNFDKARWQNLNPRQMSRLWSKNVEAGMVYGANLMRVTVYGKSAEDAVNFGQAVAQTVVSHGFEYVGAGVVFKVVDNPVANPWQTRPNVWLNSIIGFILGVILAVAWVTHYKRNSLSN